MVWDCLLRNGVHELVLRSVRRDEGSPLRAFLAAGVQRVFYQLAQAAVLLLVVDLQLVQSVQRLESLRRFEVEVAQVVCDLHEVARFSYHLLEAFFVYVGDQLDVLLDVFDDRCLTALHEVFHALLLQVEREGVFVPQREHAVAEAVPVEAVEVVEVVEEEVEHVFWCELRDERLGEVFEVEGGLHEVLELLGEARPPVCRARRTRSLLRRRPTCRRSACS